ncbi:growth/differentiation factor 9 [Rhincodon typus]|uniref:growth/differentiation factor 9 n=1 Tax=Rhincodon typus TaxID=259920 RepID=UPI00202DCFBA|nr:growth/differentiation factor 9 [Rhincodon typus]
MRRVKGAIMYLHYSVWLALLSNCISPTTSVSSASPAVTSNPQDYIPVPLLKVLTEKPGWDYQIPTKPDLKYMKRLYTKCATQDGIPKRPAAQQYNTVRLLTPRVESRDTEDVFEQDVFYGLDPVTSREQLLRSVFLYPVDKSACFPTVCNCSFTIQEGAHAQMCTSSPRSYTFRLRFERRKRRQWLEVELASFLQPFIGPDRGQLHAVFTYKCTEAGRRQGGCSGLRPSLPAPSLLLFLNDTGKESHRSWLPTDAQKSRLSGGRKGRKVAVRSIRLRRDPQGGDQAFSAAFPPFPYPDHECQLHDFRLSFSQLRWDRWIIAPHSYNPRFCKGSCPRALSHRYGSPVHTLIQNILYEKVDSSVPRPSCVPAKYNPLSVLTLENDGSIVYKEYEDMIATTCTCR